MSVSKPGFHTHSIDSDDNSIYQNPLLNAALLDDAVVDDDSVATASSRHAHFEARGRGAVDGNRHRGNSSSTDGSDNYRSPPLPRASSQRMHEAHGYRLNSDSDRYAPCW